MEAKRRSRGVGRLGALARSLRWSLGSGMLAASAAIASPQQPAERTRDAPRPEAAVDGLQRAAELKSRARRVRGLERARLLEAAIATYRGVAARWPGDGLTAAEACFRAGEILRWLERDAEARTEFASARRLGALTSFGARAGLELAHLARRAGELEAARSEFEAVARDERSERRYRDDAALWAARMDAELGRVEIARRAFEAVARSAESVLDRIDAYDEWCQTYVDAGDLEAAAGVLALCRDALRELALEETPLGERVRNALSRMHSVRRLERAVRARAKGVTLTKQ